jgi:hypothetical protein
MIAKAGAGPVPVPFKEMTAETLADSITFALKPKVQISVQEMAAQIEEEHGDEDTVEDWNDRIDIDDFRCDLFPERLAIWQHKKSKAQLSGFAVSCLIQKHAIQHGDVKMLKRRHWYVDEGAEWVSGSTSIHTMLSKLTYAAIPRIGCNSNRLRWCNCQCNERVQEAHEKTSPSTNKPRSGEGYQADHAATSKRYRRDTRRMAPGPREHHAHADREASTPNREKDASRSTF